RRTDRSFRRWRSWSALRCVCKTTTVRRAIESSGITKFPIGTCSTASRPICENAEAKQSGTRWNASLPSIRKEKGFMKPVTRYQSRLLFRKSYKPNRIVRIRPAPGLNFVFRPAVLVRKPRGKEHHEDREGAQTEESTGRRSGAVEGLAGEAER